MLFIFNGCTDMIFRNHALAYVDVIFEFLDWPAVARAFPEPDLSALVRSRKGLPPRVDVLRWVAQSIRALSRIRP